MAAVFFLDEDIRDERDALLQILLAVKQIGEKTEKILGGQKERE